MNTPYSFLLFNRPMKPVRSLTSKNHKPKLHVACDGPRKNIEGDAENVDKTRKILDQKPGIVN